MTRGTRVLGHMVVRNEMGRYLPQVIDHLLTITDGLAIFDDQSTDGTFEYLRSRTKFVYRRRDQDPSFSANEGGFRSAGWRYMEGSLSPDRSDWILCIDADEFLLGNGALDLRDELLDTIEDAQVRDRKAIHFSVAEVFGFDTDGVPLVRTDGFWGAIRACRLVQWRPQGAFSHVIEGGGSVPTGWLSWGFRAEYLKLLHLGYARSHDREERTLRYQGGRGHNPRHVASIRQPGTLVRWVGQPIPLEAP